MRFIFTGTTEFGIPILEKLIANRHELLFVITQPDKPVGRKQQLTAPPIKLWAQKNNIRVLQPNNMLELRDEIALPKPDLLLVAAYGQIIPKSILDLPTHASVNVHGSILPKYRGASPIQAALLNGDKTTGITLIKMDEKMDHGPIIATRETEIGPDETFIQLYERLSRISADFVNEALPKYIAGQITVKPQADEQATFTKLLNTENGKIDWTHSATEIYNQIRALNPEPGTWTTLDNKIVKILEAKILPGIKIELPGKLYLANDQLVAKAADHSIIILKLHPAGGKSMTGAEFARGIKNLSGKHFV